jgi:outer membrane protein
MYKQIAYVAIWTMVGAGAAIAQQAPVALPDAPGATVPMQAAAQSSIDPAIALVTLTRQQAEQIALKNNPRVSIAGLLARAQGEVVRETRSAEYPTFDGELSAVDALQGSRISTGSLSASRLVTHVGAGVRLDQLITDFGRTRNLVASSSLQAKASDQNDIATQEDVILAVDLAFYRALEAQATLAVAKSTVSARQAVGDQVSALTASKLKSTLDQSFAQVNVSQAQLLNLDAQNQSDAAMASLNEVLGTTVDQPYTLVDDPEPPAPLAATADAVLALSLRQRPDLQALLLAHDADVRFARAQRDQLLPTVTGLGIVGATPVGSTDYFAQNWYGAAGVNVEIPIFDGFKFHSEAQEASLRAKASDQQSRLLMNRIARDVRTAWLTMNTAQQRMTVTAALLKEANTALDLAQTRYNLGLSSIVELSQAQLQQTQAQIEQANARFDYEADLAALRFQSGTQP